LISDRDADGFRRCAWCDRAAIDPPHAVALGASDGETLWACDAACLSAVITDLAGSPGLTLDDTILKGNYPS
jgi:hypothetical protein